MLRKVTGSSSNPPVQINSVQSENPATPPLVGQSSVSQASDRSSLQAMQAKGKGKAKQLREQMQKKNKEKAKGWCARFIAEVSGPAHSLKSDLEKRIDDALLMNYFNAKRQLDALVTNVSDNNKEQNLKQNAEQVSAILETINNAISVFNENDKKQGVFSKAITTLKEFNSLPQATKSQLCAADHRLSDFENKAKEALMQCKISRMVALQIKAASQILHLAGRRGLLGEKRQLLMEKISAGGYSDSVRRDVGKLIDEFDNLSKDNGILFEEQSKNIEAWDSLLSEPHRPHTKDEEKRKERANRTLGAQVMLSEISMRRMINPIEKLYLLMPLVMHDSTVKQEDESVWKWHQLTESLVYKEHKSIYAVSHKLIDNEAILIVEGVDKLSPEELSMGLEAAREESNRYSKIIRTCGKRIEEYENLEGIIKDDKLIASLKGLMEAAADFLLVREFAPQLWADKFQELQDRKASFLPKGVQLPRPKLHKTSEGVVLGQINDNGELKSQDESGKFIATYFKDQDNDNWVKDYGDDPDSAQPASSAVSTASGSKTAVTSKVDRFALKADNIAQASTRFSENAFAKVAASSDYDDKASLLSRAYSKNFKAVEAVQNLLVDMKFELKELPAKDLKDLPEKDLLTVLNSHLKRLKADKEKLSKQLSQTTRELNHHFLKKRDPTETGFKFLREQGQVASIVKAFNREPSHNNANDLLDRYVISFSQGAQGEDYDPWIVHAHYDSNAFDAAPVRVHMKRNAEKDWGWSVEQQAYHSRPLSKKTFDLIKQEAQKQDAPSVKKGNRKRR